MEIIERKAVAKHPKKLRVCAYCRVSTDAEEQENFKILGADEDLRGTDKVQSRL